jgi:hypothetical protein
MKNTNQELRQNNHPFKVIKQSGLKARNFVKKLTWLDFSRFFAISKEIIHKNITNILSHY